ncbi:MULTISPECIES: sensor histidine kinase [unclassified Sphingomonas]|uniref:sensor histidine kinase n=1 Tax=unclassified Sphingomonas TaxID=196159 RepID=UPI000B1B55B3|nr:MULTISPECIES: HAMP domain-containing sensor histidine kinase [unclassified Sphingomonas]
MRLARSIPRSIHGRMLALSVATTLVALPVAGFAIGGVLDHFVTRNIDARLGDRLRLLRAVVREDGTIDRALLDRSGLATAIGADAVWRIDTPGGTVGVGLPILDAVPARGPPGRPERGPPPGWGPGFGAPFDLTLPDATRVHGLMLDLPGDGGRVAVAVPRRQIDQPLRGAMLPLLLTLAIVAVVLAVATLVQLRLGLRPLRALRDRVAAVRGGAAADVPEDQPDELRPLAIELNALVRDNAAALATARASAANLAHALKTPVATLAIELGNDARASQVARIDATIRHHLARARGGTVDRRAATALQPAVEGLVAVVAALHRDRGLTIGTDVPALSVAVDAADLDELVGNLIDNAARHARSRVRLSAAVERGMAVLTVSDDGPGIAAADRVRATDPGVRLDERGDGHGFGLAIVRDLAALYGGGLTLGEADGGGLVATVTLPLSREAGTGIAGY